MKKLLLIIGLTIILSACGKGGETSPTLDENANTFAWYSMTIDFPEDWELQKVDNLYLRVGNTSEHMDFQRDAKIDRTILVEDISIAGQNYRYIPANTDTGNTFTTAWERSDYVITTTLNFEKSQAILETLRKPRMQWSGYEFERPGGSDWYYELDLLGFVNDDGNFLENKTHPPCDYARPDHEICDNLPLLTIEIRNEPLEIVEGSLTAYPDRKVTYFDLTEFDEISYQIMRYTDTFTTLEMVLYVGLLPDGKYLWIDAQKHRDDDAQDILNELIGL